MRRRYTRLIVTVLVCTMSFLVITTIKSTAKGANTQVVAPTDTVDGLTYAQWSERFEQWSVWMPYTANPLFDTADCSAGQTGPVWFLGGTWVSTPLPSGVTLGKADRHCSVPSGTYLFFPIMNAECSQAEGNGSTYDELKACASGYADMIDWKSFIFTVDGQSPISKGDWPTYRKVSNEFWFGPLLKDNLFKGIGETVDQTTPSPCVSDGYWVMLKPLSEGSHIIHFWAQVSDGSYQMDITYHINVVGHNNCRRVEERK